MHPELAFANFKNRDGEILPVKAYDTGKQDLEKDEGMTMEEQLISDLRA